MQQTSQSLSLAVREMRLLIIRLRVWVCGGLESLDKRQALFSSKFWEEFKNNF